MDNIFSDFSLPQFIFLIESTQPGKNLTKYDRLSLTKCIDLVIKGDRTIHNNGINQVKICCQVRKHANLLIRSADFKRRGFELSIPSFRIRKKAFT